MNENENRFNKNFLTPPVCLAQLANSVVQTGANDFRLNDVLSAPKHLWSYLQPTLHKLAMHSKEYSEVFHQGLASVWQPALDTATDTHHLFKQHYHQMIKNIPSTLPFNEMLLAGLAQYEIPKLLYSFGIWSYKDIQRFNIFSHKLSIEKAQQILPREKQPLPKGTQLKFCIHNSFEDVMEFAERHGDYFAPPKKVLNIVQDIKKYLSLFEMTIVCFNHDYYNPQDRILPVKDWSKAGSDEEIEYIACRHAIMLHGIHWNGDTNHTAFCGNALIQGRLTKKFIELAQCINTDEVNLDNFRQFLLTSDYLGHLPLPIVLTKDDEKKLLCQMIDGTQKFLNQQEDKDWSQHLVCWHKRCTNGIMYNLPKYIATAKPITLSYLRDCMLKTKQ